MLTDTRSHTIRLSTHSHPNSSNTLYISPQIKSWEKLAFSLYVESTILTYSLTLDHTLSGRALICTQTPVTLSSINICLQIKSREKLMFSLSIQSTLQQLPIKYNWACLERVADELFFLVRSLRFMLKPPVRSAGLVQIKEKNLQIDFTIKVRG